MKKILIIDVETTALEPKDGELVEFGASELDIETMQTKEIESFIINTGIELPTDAWIFQNSSLTPEILSKGISKMRVRYRIKTLFNQYKFVTAYNKQFDFGWIEYHFNIKPTYGCQCIMEAATPVLDIYHDYYDTKWPSVQECMRFFGWGGIEPHRAGEDTLIEANILRELIKMKKYHVPHELEAEEE